ncbi:hypothetical protein N136_04642 [Leifsonia aquatica ATCC 14665]|uniref:Uncharacterized protein n=1 Tax=Leifsonia aquatica ATCC 14665 TaxID=1358026 RepID=U2RFH7_LEIAQ|nr:hypothetical protein N136_04642 [Leifsonia aquatica ATCC 14665]
MCDGLLRGRPPRVSVAADRDPSAGGETHERSIHIGCSPAVHDRAAEVVVTGSPRQAFRERRLP